MIVKYKDIDEEFISLQISGFEFVKDVSNFVYQGHMVRVYISNYNYILYKFTNGTSGSKLDMEMSLSTKYMYDSENGITQPLIFKKLNNNTQETILFLNQIFKLIKENARY